MRVLLLFVAALIAATVAARVQYDASFERRYFPALTQADLVRIQELTQQTNLDPDVNRTFTQIVNSKGYPCEYHEVNTTDGYILGMFRLPWGQKTPNNIGKPVFLMHGFADSGFTWIVNMPDQALPYMLADAGYDVWIGNIRGSRYGMKHKTLNPSQEAFWSFSWDEHALKDLPAMIDYVLHETNSTKLGYVGHSQGCATMFAALSAIPNMSSKLNNFVALAPVVKTAAVTVPFLRGLAALHLDDFIGLFGDRAFLPTPPLIVRILGTEFCGKWPLVCSNVIELLVGRHEGSLNETRIPVVVANYPAGTSVQNVRHWAQMVRHNTFSMYSFGKLGNLARYGSLQPPAYNVVSFPASLPLAIIYGGVDKLAAPTDVEDLIRSLPVKPTLVKLLPAYAHMDFPWAKTAGLDLGPEVLAMMQKFNI